MLASAHDTPEKPAVRVIPFGNTGLLRILRRGDRGPGSSVVERGFRKAQARGSNPLWGSSADPTVLCEPLFVLCSQGR